MNQKPKHDTFWYCDKAEKHGMTVKFDHRNPIIETPDGDDAIMLPANLKSAHTEGLIKKWLLRFGVMLLLAVVILYVL